MHVKDISIKNFRLLKDTSLTFKEQEKQDLSLLIGKNNSGKTSFIMIFDKFFKSDNHGFDFNDFSLCLRKEILDIKDGSDLSSCAIQMKIEIVYTEQDDLTNLSEFILDLDPQKNIVKILFECSIDEKKLISELAFFQEKNRKKFIEYNLKSYLKVKYFTYNDESDLEQANRNVLVKKEITDIKKLINYQVIHAKRNVSSSEYQGGGKTPLSELTTNYFNKDNSFAKEAFNDINDSILDMDNILNEKYKQHFKEYFSNVIQFTGEKNSPLSVISNLESRQILSNYSRVVYGNENDYLPETLNGLGHLNILFLLLQIEIKKKFFIQENKNINLLFIEEPEAHTHPQMQYTFGKEIENILLEIPNLQTFMTTHSSHIVSQCKFENIRYLKSDGNNVVIKNFYGELEGKYAATPDYFKFLKQYLTLYSSELFFAEKVIFIEGVSERLLLPFFIQKYDKSRQSEVNYIPLKSQNISYIEAGANAKVFSHFIEFLDIKTLIFTDFDGTTFEGKSWKAYKTHSATNTSNATIKHFLSCPKRPKTSEEETKKEELIIFTEWFKNFKENNLPSINPKIKISYQIEENGYHARSFEDSFLSMNLDLINTNKNDIEGLQLKKDIDTKSKQFYEITEKHLKKDGKSDFASSILYLALTKEIDWQTPKYIVEGLNWIAE